MAISNPIFLTYTVYCQFGVPFSEKLKPYQSIGGATMRNYKSLVLIVATIMLFSFAAVPPANAIIGTAALAAILATVILFLAVWNKQLFILLFYITYKLQAL